MSRCWMCDEGGDRCVLKMDHPGPHMAGFHVFEKNMSAESIARTMGIAYDTLASEVARLRRERDALLAAAQMVLGQTCEETVDDAGTSAACDCDWCRAWRALKNAVAACEEGT